jgi:hypothetical protein
LKEVFIVSTGPYEGVVRGETIVLLEGDLRLAEGTKVLVTPVATEVGSQQALLAAVLGEPHVRVRDVQEMQSLIDEASRPLAAIEPFSDTPNTPSSPNG